MLRRLVLPSSFVAVLACSRPQNVASAPPPPRDAAAPSPEAAVALVAPTDDAGTDAAVAAVAASSTYPTWPCTAAELAEAARGLPAREGWASVDATPVRARLRVPAGLFVEKRTKTSFRLGAKHHRGLAIELWRVGRSLDDVLAEGDELLLPGSTRQIFPTKKAASFISDEENWHTTRLLVAGKPAYVWTSGLEGEEKDVVLVEAGRSDTLVVHADWQTQFVNGAPTCAERLLIAGVIESLTLLP